MKFKVPLLLEAVALCGVIASTSGDAAAAAPPVSNHRIRSATVDRCATAVSGEVFTQNTGCVTTSAYQKYDIISLGGSQYRIRNRGLTSELGFDICMELGIVQGGATPTMNPCIVGPVPPSQRWTITSAGSDRYRLCMSDGVNNYCLTAGAAGTNIRVEQPSSSLAAFQVWRFLP